MLTSLCLGQLRFCGANVLSTGTTLIDLGTILHKLITGELPGVDGMMITSEP